MSVKTKCAIVGGGAAGLMAAVSMAEAGLTPLLMERRNRVGSKVLLCANNRCNLSSDLSTQEFIDRYDSPSREFLQQALSSFSSTQLQAWFASRGCKTRAHKNGRIFPVTEKSADVVHTFNDRLRDLKVPLLFNAAVDGVTMRNDVFELSAGPLQVSAENVLLTTGGVSYPKTGSVGDGQKFARQLGHRITPFRAGLAGLVPADGSWTEDLIGIELSDVVLKWQTGKEELITAGELVINGKGLLGPAAVDMSSFFSRRNVKQATVHLDLFPQLQKKALCQQLAAGTQAVSELLKKKFGKEGASRLLSFITQSTQNARVLAEQCKAVPIEIVGLRPLKEAMVTVGGVSLDEVDPATMQSRVVPGLYFAGEVLDFDGPTGGFNLHAAFATARTAVTSIAGKAPFVELSGGVRGKRKNHKAAVKQGKGAKQRRRRPSKR